MLKLVLVNLQGERCSLNPLPASPLIAVSISPILYCQNETAMLSAIPSLNCRLIGTQHLTEGPNSTSPTPSTTATGTSYYVSQTNTLTGCEGARSEIIVIVNTRPVAPL
jgi:hypothetical protein